jgi:hypothetical protein
MPILNEALWRPTPESPSPFPQNEKSSNPQNKKNNNLMKKNPSGMKANRMIALALALTAQPALAGDIFNINYDASTPTEISGFGFAGYGAPGGGNVTVDSSITTTVAIEPLVGVAASSALRFTADTTDTQAAIITPNNYSYMGFGVRTNVNSLLTPLPTSNLANYKLDVSVGAAGFKAGVTKANCLVDVRFFAPDDTVVPADADTDFDLVLGLRFQNAVVAKAAIESFSIRLNRTSELRDGTTLARFNTYFASVNFIQTVVEAGNGINDFGFDAGNVLIVDNLVLNESVPPPPPAETPVVIIDYDASPRSYGGAWYAFARSPDDANSLVRTDDLLDLVGVGGSFAQRTGIDTTPWGPPYVVTTNFLGFAGVAHVDTPAGLLTSSSLADYKVAVDVRSSGFVNIPNGKLILELFAPDDYFLPADANTDPDSIVRFRFEGATGFPITADYTTVARSLTDATFDSGSPATFAANFTAVTGYRFSVEAIANPQSAFGFDADNFVFIDNLKVIRLSSPNVLPVITSVVATAPSQFALTFTSQAGNSYGIFRSTTLGTFTQIATVPATSATTTYTRNQALIGKEFFRVANLGPTPAP